MASLNCWPDIIILYAIDLAFAPSEKCFIKSVLSQFKIFSPIEFIEYSPSGGSQKPYFFIKKEDGKARSTLGYSDEKRLQNNGRVGTLWICPGRFISLPHEIFHTLGFIHEHQRWDRDDNVEVKMNHLASDDKKRNWQKIYSEDMGLPYNVHSVMHYSSKPIVKDHNNMEISIMQSKGPDPNDIGYQTKHKDYICQFKTEVLNGTFIKLDVKGLLQPCDIARINRVYCHYLDPQELKNYYLGDDIKGALPYNDWRQNNYVRYP